MTPNSVVWVTDTQRWRHSSIYLIVDVGPYRVVVDLVGEIAGESPSIAKSIHFGFQSRNTVMWRITYEDSNKPIFETNYQTVELFTGVSLEKTVVEPMLKILTTEWYKGAWSNKPGNFDLVESMFPMCDEETMFPVDITRNIVDQLPITKQHVCGYTDEGIRKKLRKARVL